MDDTEGSSRRKLGPVDGLAQPLQVVTEELVVRRAGVHEGVAKGDGSVEDGVTSLQAVAHLVENAQVGVIIAVEELEV